MYRVIVARKADKQLAKIDSRYQQSIRKAIYFLRADPFSGKKLDPPHAQRYVVRVWPYRIIYEIDRENKIVNVIAIGHRQGVYK